MTATNDPKLKDAIASMITMQYHLTPTVSNTGEAVTELARLLTAVGNITATFGGYGEVASALTWLLIAARHPNLAGHMLERAVPQEVLDHLAILADATHQVYDDLAL